MHLSIHYPNSSAVVYHTLGSCQDIPLVLDYNLVSELTHPRQYSEHGVDGRLRFTCDRAAIALDRGRKVKRAQ